MKAAQIKKYSKEIKASVNEIPISEPKGNEILVNVKKATINPLEIFQITGSIKLIQDYRKPFTLGNECSGIVEKIGNGVKNFKIGDKVYMRLPLGKIGAFAEYVTVDHEAVAKMPHKYDFVTAAVIPLAGLTAYQGLVEGLEARPGNTLLITGASGSFGQIAMPIAMSMGLRVVVTGNTRSKEKFLKMGIARHIDYKEENYWETLSDIDYAIDTFFTRMLQIIDWLYLCNVDGFQIEEIACTSKECIDPNKDSSMSDAQLGFVNNFDDGTTWPEVCLDHPAFKHICICHAVHDICTHKNFSIPDLLHMNDFWCEIKITHQHIVEQDGRRREWWKDCSFEEFREKLLSEAEHHPKEWRLGQYIVNRTSELFPDFVGRLHRDNQQDCYSEDNRTDVYLRELFDKLKES